MKALHNKSIAPLKIGTMIALAGLFWGGPAKAVTISGFLNAEYNQFNLGKTKSADPDQNPPNGGFDIQRIGINFQHEQDIFTIFVQIQIEHAAQFGDAADGKGANSSSPIGFGEIATERAWLEARFDPKFRLKFGKEITPTLWQRAHYPSVYTSITNPQIENNTFEEYLVGLLAEGDLPAGFVYNAWLNKSMNTVSEDPTTYHQTATDTKTLAPSVGGRFGWQIENKNSSAYFGGLAAGYHDLPNRFVYGFESALKWKNVSLWSEYSKAPTTRGWYLLPSYTFALSDESEISPYILYDVFNDDAVGPDSRKVAAIGLNFKPKAYLTIKGEGVFTSASNTELVSRAVRLGVVYYFN